MLSQLFYNKFNERGQAVVEYAFLIGFISITVIWSLMQFGIGLEDVYEAFLMLVKKVI